MTNGQKYTLLAAALITPLSLFAQVASPSGAQNPVPSQVASLGPMDTSMNSSGGVDAGLMRDKIFVRKATEGGFAVVQFGQLAATKASSDDVKKLGQKMVDDQTMIGGDMQPVADELGVRMPTKMNKVDQEEFDKLSALSGDGFDKEYVSYTLKVHRKDLHECRTEAAQTTDPQLKEAISNQEKVIATHLFLVNKAAVVLGVSSAHKPGWSAPPVSQ